MKYNYLSTTLVIGVIFKLNVHICAVSGIDIQPEVFTWNILIIFPNVLPYGLELQINLPDPERIN